MISEFEYLEISALCFGTRGSWIRIPPPRFFTLEFTHTYRRTARKGYPALAQNPPNSRHDLPGPFGIIRNRVHRAFHPAISLRGDA